MFEVTFRVRSTFAIARFTEDRPRLAVAFRLLRQRAHDVDVLASFGAPPGTHAAFLRAIPGALPLARRGEEGAYRARVPEEGAFPLGALATAVDEALSGGAVLGAFTAARGEVTASVLALDSPSPEDALRRLERDARLRECGLSVLNVAPRDPLEAAAGGAGGLTSREAETLRLALALGYYESPRQCTMEDVASHLGITKSAVYRRMSAMERKAVERLVAELGPGTGDIAQIRHTLS